MSSNPYASFGAPQGGPGDFLAPEPSRMSVLAIVAFILSLLCIPPTGALAVVLGGTAVLFIGNSAGRLRGLGLGIAAIIIGLLTTLIWIVLLIGARQALGLFANVAKPADQAIIAMQSGDLKAARAELAPSSDQIVTDEMMRTFVAGYTAELGQYKGAGPMDMISWIRALMRHKATTDAMTGGGRTSQDELPFVAVFDKGEAVVLMQFRPKPGAAPAGGLPPLEIENLSIWTSPTKSIWLIDESKLPRRPRGQPPATPTTATPAPAAPDAPSADTPTAPADAPKP